MSKPRFEVEAEWVHLSFAEDAALRDVYGFASGHGLINLEGIRYLPRGAPARSLLVYMHPASTLQLLPMPRAMAERGVHVLCAGSRYARNDTALVMEKVLLDFGAYMRHARERWGYRQVVLAGWSGGGSLSMLYQAEAEQPTITDTPAGDPMDIAGARLPPADGVIFQAAHISRAEMLAGWIDPSVLDEGNPDRRDPELDLYDPRNPNRPPYAPAYVERFRAAQLARLRRRTAWVLDTLETLRRRGGKELERCFVTHRTMADPRYLDAAIEPNDRLPGACFLGDPETANSGPVGIARFSTLRAWLSQWSIDHTRAHAERCAPRITVPLLAVENSADDAVPQSHTGRLHHAAGSADKTLRVLKGATHYYVGQPELLDEAARLCLEWMAERGFV
ncbi:MAG: alpha/beta hydrolase [Burkholderiales bacterium]|nr:alpha/beta hydrolase [Burkholderiales bacterium]